MYDIWIVKMKRIKNDYFVLILIIVLYSFLGIIGIGCPIKFLSGISCLGCGMTRAVISALKLDFIKAIEYHPLFWILIPAFIVCFLRPRMNSNIYRICIYTAILLFVAVYVYRLFFSESDVVSADPRNGIIYKLFISALRRN